ncbi:MAG: 16S rRNA (uracil(1498)-N(3))-methyltransferase [Alphaproteobacteria bacterium]|nr:16S rRNA (uracil(1498)-N(3))-methyltransferase [Alphaproteobacteria bacterium]
MKSSKETRHTPRLFVEGALGAGQSTSVSPDQAHYLQNVMRMQAGDALRLFNGRDGEWLASIAAVSKRSVDIKLEKQLRPQQAAPDLSLCCAPIKKAHFDYMIEKATELGVSVLQPILTSRTQIREVNTERGRGIAIEAAEQSDRLDIPEIYKPLTLAELAAQWPGSRIPIICAEWGEALPAQKALASLSGKSQVAIFTGPEGGFTAEELEALRKLPQAVFIRLGPRILRADTAAIAALSLWQGLCGDWQQGGL